MSKLGVLFCVFGPRGTGKDRIIEGAKHRLAGDPRFVFPWRIITQAGFSGDGVVHQTVTPAQFEALRRNGALALHWYDCGVGFAIPRSIDADLAAGRAVVAHVARQVVPTALRKYPRVVLVEVKAPAWLVAERLAREDLAILTADRRVLTGDADSDADYVIQNDGLLDTAVSRFVDALTDTVAPRGHVLSDDPLQPTSP